MFSLSVRKFHNQFNNVIKILIISDFLVWSGANMLTVIFPLFVINQIDGANIEHAGFASMLYLVISAVVTVPIGIIMDKTKGYVDEVNFLICGTVLRGICLFVMSFASAIWHLYLMQVIFGILRAAIFPSWRVLFTKFTDSEKEGMEWSTYDAVTSIGMGFAAYLGTFIAEEVSYKVVWQVSAFITLLGSLLLLFLKMFIKKKKVNSEVVNSQ